MENVETFFRSHPVFTLSQFRKGAGGRATASTAQARVKYHLRRGHLKLVERGVYAVVPPGVEAEHFVPDRFLVAATLRNDAVLGYHSALELLGLAHSTYRDTFYFTSRRRKDLVLSGGRVRAFLHPKRLREKGEEGYGVETRERLGIKIRVTGPERTFVDSLAAPRYAGGLEEVFQCAGGIATLDLNLLWGYLERLGQKRLFAAVGLFLEREADRLFVPPQFLGRLSRERPHSPSYLDRVKRGGRLVSRWNLIVPERWVKGFQSFEV